MDSGTVCKPVQAAPCSMPGVAKGANASPSDVNSLRGSNDFRRVLGGGRRSRRGAITVVGARGTGEDTRVGLVVRKDVGNAVRRNRVKRRIRHALADVSLEQGMDYVIMAGRQVLEVPFPDLTRWLQHAVDGVR
jgi:ribonuclease P protein component